MAGLAVPPQMGLAGGGGIVPVVTLAQLQADERKATELTQVQPVIQGLAGHVKTCFTASYQAKQQTIEERLLKCVRQRRGEYEPDVLAEIKKASGSTIYMMLTANKCRAASSWIRDVMFGTRDQRPYDLEPSSEPELSPAEKQDVVAQATQAAMEMEQQIGQTMVGRDQMKDLITRIRDTILAESKERAKHIMTRMKSKMEDQLQEGGFYRALDQFVDDLVTFPYAVIKGPVPRMVKALAWVPAGQGKFDVDVKDQIQLCWDRVDPFNLYWAPHATEVDDGYLIERHQMARRDLIELKGVEGYNTGAIDAVLADHGRGGLKDWLAIDSAKASAEGKSISEFMANPEATIDALQYWGSVQGQMLIDWGMDAEEVQDPTAEYFCEVWTIGRWVIKAVMNADPCGRKPYYKTSYEEIPGTWAGNGVSDLVRDAQNMCNAAARALANNMGIASGPQVYVTMDRLPSGESVTEVYPWRIWQVTSDPYGSTSKPIEFFQPQSNADELMKIYMQFSVLADEYSGVPRYMTGDSPAGGAGRTASGMSMLMNNAGKSIKQVIANIDMNVTQPLIERLYYYNMKYSDDPELKGDVRVIACGVNVLVAQEEAQVRKNEVLNIVLTNPVLIEIVGEEAIADLLREVVKPLNMNIVPPKEVIRARVLMKQQMAMMQAMSGQVPEQPGAEGKGPKIMPGNKQTLENGGRVTDNFAPQRRA